MIDIFISPEFADWVDQELLEKSAISALNHESILDEVELTIVVDADERLQELNHQFRGIDAPTDVLSFPADEFDPDTGLQYLGDMMISFPTAKRQADEASVPVMDELQLLVIHGILHLLGHDHAEKDEKERMWLAQTEILGKLGINLFDLPE